MESPPQFRSVGSRDAEPSVNRLRKQAKYGRGRSGQKSIMVPDSRQARCQPSRRATCSDSFDSREVHLHRTPELIGGQCRTRYARLDKTPVKLGILDLALGLRADRASSTFQSYPPKTKVIIPKLFTKCSQELRILSIEVHEDTYPRSQASAHCKSSRYPPQLPYRNPVHVGEGGQDRLR